MISFAQLSRKLLASKWTWISLVAVPAMRFYYVQEMVAALMIFSVLFLGISTVALVVFLLDRATQQVAVWTEAGVAWLVHSVAGAVESVVARPVWAQAVPHRFRKELKESEKN